MLRHNKKGFFRLDPKRLILDAYFQICAVSGRQQ